MRSVIFVVIIVLLGVGVVSSVRGAVRQRAYRRQRRHGDLSAPVQPPVVRRGPKAPRAVPEGRRRLDTDGLVSLSLGSFLVLVTGVLVLERMDLPRLVVVGLPVVVVGGALVWIYTDRG